MFNNTGSINIHPEKANHAEDRFSPGQGALSRASMTSHPRGQSSKINTAIDYSCRIKKIFMKIISYIFDSF